MKGKLFVIMALSAGMMLSACSGSKKNNGNLDGENPDEALIDESDDPTGIVSIRESWADNEIDVDAGDVTPDIEQFALAFCQEYPQCATNKAMMDYLLSSDDFDSDMFDVTVDHQNSYIRCMELVQTAPFTCVCFWGSDTGHKIVVASLESTHESGVWDEDLVVFYDYDPYSDTMTPEPSLTNMIEERVDGYDTYSVELPQEGCDITVYGYTVDEESDSVETDTFILEWNGTTFEWAE